MQALLSDAARTATYQPTVANLATHLSFMPPEPTSHALPTPKKINGC